MKKKKYNLDFVCTGNNGNNIERWIIIGKLDNNRNASSNKISGWNNTRDITIQKLNLERRTKPNNLVKLTLL